MLARIASAANLETQWRKNMKVQISVGQVFDHESGQEWEVVRITERTVTFETSVGDLMRMDIDDVVADIATDTLALQDGFDNEDEEE